jgi:hypothetical protein
MDMSYARMVRTASLTSYPVRCKILYQRTTSAGDKRIEEKSSK